MKNLLRMLMVALFAMFFYSKALANTKKLHNSKQQKSKVYWFSKSGKKVYLQSKW